MLATTPGRCRLDSGTRTFSIPSATPNWRQIGSKIFGGEVLMKSNVFSHFKIPVLDYDIQAERDERGIPVLSFRAPGAGLQRLDMTGASQLKQLLEQAGDNANAQVIADLIKKAQGH
jgi:hypothetical protein